MTLTEERLDATFSALADPTRRAIIIRLSMGEATVKELAEPFTISLQAVSKHIKVLERSGLISQGVDAQRQPCRLDPAPTAAPRPQAPSRLRPYRTRTPGQERTLAPGHPRRQSRDRRPAQQGWDEARSNASAATFSRRNPIAKPNVEFRMSSE